MLKILLAAFLATAAGAEPRRALAKLTIATGPVEIKGEGDPDYKALASGGDLSDKTWIRTGAKAKAVFNYSDGTELRINENTEFFVDNARSIELKVGEFFLIAVNNPNSPFHIKTQYSPIEFTGGSIDLSFIHRDPNDPLTKTVSRTVTTLIVFNGTIQVGSKRYNQKVTLGYWCTLVDATLNTPDQVGDASIPTRWVHEILLRQGKITPEVQTRLQDMFQMLGRYPEGKEDPSEKGYRSLGELSAPFLAKYIGRPAGPVETTRRQAAARILADVATKAEAPDLVAALRDPDVDTRLAVARGLARIAGTDLKFNEAFWKGDKREAGEKAWDEWVKKNPAPKK